MTGNSSVLQPAKFGHLCTVQYVCVSVCLFGFFPAGTILVVGTCMYMVINVAVIMMSSRGNIPISKVESYLTNHMI